MKFVKRELPLFDSSKIIRYTSHEFVVSASRQGISLEGSASVSSQDDLELLAEHIAKAWQHYQAMRGENGVSDKFPME